MDKQVFSNIDEEMIKAIKKTPKGFLQISFEGDGSICGFPDTVSKLVSNIDDKYGKDALRKYFGYASVSCRVSKPNEKDEIRFYFECPESIGGPALN